MNAKGHAIDRDMNIKEKFDELSESIRNKRLGISPGESVAIRSVVPQLKSVGKALDQEPSRIRLKRKSGQVEEIKID